MLVGDTSIFAIESFIFEAYSSVSQRALGFFIVHLNGQSFGIRDPQASLLACSFDEVGRRIAQRGTHAMPMLGEISADQIAAAFDDAVYVGNTQRSYFGMPLASFAAQLHASRVQWAPDGDEAFDDGTHILHFDVDDKVRLVAFTTSGTSKDLTAIDIWLDAAKFYQVMEDWRRSFKLEWRLRLEQQ